MNDDLIIKITKNINGNNDELSLINSIDDKIEKIVKTNLAWSDELRKELLEGKQIHAWAAVKQIYDSPAGSKFAMIIEKKKKAYLAEIIGSIRDDNQEISTIIGWNGTGYEKVIFFKNIQTVDINDAKFDEIKKLTNLKKVPWGHAPIYKHDKILNAEKKEQFYRIINTSSVPIQSTDTTISFPKHNKNTILYGPPGTGKTFKTKEKAVRIIAE